MEFAKRMAARPGMHLDTLLQEEERGEVTSNRPLSRPEIERKGRKEGRGEVKEVECVRMGF